MEEDVMLRMSIVTDVAAALVVMLAAIGMPGTAWAQATVTSFDQLPVRLKVGQMVSVTDTAGAEQKGKILDLSPTALTLAVDGTRHEFPAARVSAIKKRQRDSLLNGALIGLAVGVGVTVLAASACEDDLGDCYVMGLLIFGGIGTGAGIGIDLATKGKMQTIYQAPSASAGLRVTVAPFVVPHRQGVAIRVSF
jgi:hypothetical protein